jgi:hypothetical protein
MTKEKLYRNRLYGGQGLNNGARTNSNIRKCFFLQIKFIRFIKWPDRKNPKLAPSETNGFVINSAFLSVIRLRVNCKRKIRNINGTRSLMLSFIRMMFTILKSHSKLMLQPPGKLFTVLNIA